MNRPFHPSQGPLANQRAAPGEAGSCSPVLSVSPTYPCPDCNGEGEAYWMALDATDYTLEECPFCDGTGIATDMHCQCGEPYDDNFWCASCREYALVEVERISATRIAL